MRIETDLEYVQVLGQQELVELLYKNKPHHNCLISIGNPLSIFIKPAPDMIMPRMFTNKFDRILRLRFYDVEYKQHLLPHHFPKKVPRLSDVKKVVKFVSETNSLATGYTIHCWRGISRSTAVALGVLFMKYQSETESKHILKRIRPEAGPHLGIVKSFDNLLGSKLITVTNELRYERLEELRIQLGIEIEAYLEEL